MTSTDFLEKALDVLGYAGATGYVDDSSGGGVGARGFIWRELHQKCGVDGAYFMGGVPMVAFAQKESTTEVLRVRGRLWNFSRVPLLIASTPEAVSAFSCFTRPSEDVSDATAELGKATSTREIYSVLEEFSRFSIETGRAVREHFASFRRQARVDRQLLINLRQLRESLLGNEDKQRALDGLIGRSIFVRYLEDRRILSPEHLEELAPFVSYVDTLEAGVAPAYDLFDALADRFNGDVFTPPSGERALLDDSDLRKVASFFRGSSVETGQQSLWPYEFAVIPPELISSIYEQLLEENQRRDAAYYTPRRVVDLMLDEVLPWASLDEKTVLDPACGSGIFLTEAFRRLAYGLSPADGERPNFERLARLLTRTMFGVDQSTAAIGVAAFGLYLALLEEVDPPTVWRDVKLPTLVEKNLFVADFFSGHPLAERRFDIVVGNPPWKSELPKAAREFVARKQLPIADEQIATAFLWRGIEALASDGTLALLLPAKSLLHNKSPQAVKVRHHLFQNFDVDTVMDLSGLRHDLFTAAVGPAAVLVARKPHQPVDTEVLHVVPRSSPLQASVEGFVISQNDVHQIPKGLALNSSDVWKIYMWGSTDDYGLITRLRSRNRTVEAIAKERNWTYGRGFAVEGRDQKDASHLTGMRLIPAEAVLPFRVSSQGVVTETEMSRPRNPRLFNGPHVLIRRGLVGGRPAAVFLQDDAAFNNSVFGISGMSDDTDLLRLLTAYVNSSLGHYYQFMTSGSWGVERDFVEMSEHLSLPFAQIDEPLARSVLQVADRVRQTPAEHNAWSALDQAVFEAYQLTEDEADLIKEALEVRLNLFQKRDRSAAFFPPQADKLTDYLERLGEVLRRSLRSVGLEAWISEKSPSHLVITVSFHELGTEGRTHGKRSILELLLHEKAVDQPSPVTILQPSIVLVQGSEVHLVKPNELRFWTPNSAKTDAAEIIGGVAAQPPLRMSS